MMERIFRNRKIGKSENRKIGKSENRKIGKSEKYQGSFSKSLESENLRFKTVGKI